MRIERLSIKGLLRFADVVTLDLRDLPPGLVAIVGPNGAGKSTLLEAGPAALYRHFMSREGELFDYASGRDSFLELDVVHDGRGAYRARVNIDGLKRTSDAVLEAIQPNGSRVVLNDGKVSTFDQVVAEHFPTREVLLASAFAAQNKAGSFVTLEKKERKTLFSTLLGLDHYQTMSDTARQAASFTDQARSRVVAVRDELARETADGILAELDRLANQLQTQGRAAEVRRAELQHTIAGLESLLALVQDQVSAYATAAQRVRTLEAELSTKRLDAKQLEQDGIRLRIETDAEVRRILETRDRQVGEVDALIANNRTLIDNAEQVRAAVATIAAIEPELATLREQERAARVTIERLDRTDRELQGQLTAIQRVQFELDAAVDGVKTLETVPCGGSDEYASCRFLGNAQIARTKIPQLQADLAKADDVHRAQAENASDRQRARSTLNDLLANILSAEKVVTAARHTASLADKLAAAEARIEELQARRTDILATAVTREQEALDRCTVSRSAIRDRQRALDLLIDDLGADLENATHDLKTAAVGNERAAGLQRQLATERTAWDENTRTLATVDAGREELERRRRELLDKRARHAELSARVERLNTELLEWQSLAKALSRDGLPVLEIDAAGPTISALTNELLAVCFGPRFTVELITQRASADGKKMVDDFSIRVFDNQQGGDPRDIADLSGGEQVLVAEALMNGISVYVNTRSSMPVRTAWRDETTGALDPQNAERYIDMLRKVHELGGFHHLFFISHNPDVAARADAQIQVADGQASIVLPPFVRDEIAA